MDNLLEILWKPATGVKPESLIGKAVRIIETKEPVIYLRQWSERTSIVIPVKQTQLLVDNEDIEYFDDSEEGIREVVKQVYCDGFDHGNSYPEISHEETLREIAENNFKDYSIEFLNKQKEV